MKVTLIRINQLPVSANQWQHFKLINTSHYGSLGPGFVLQLLFVEKSQNCYFINQKSWRKK
jgi:hypothetical protein